MAKNWIVGNISGYTSASSDNGGGYDGDLGSTGFTQAQWFTAIHDGDGGPVSVSTWTGSQTRCTVTNGGGLVRISRASGFPAADIEVGMVVNCSFAATYTSGRYLVSAVDASSGYIDISLSYSADTTCDCNVGGLFADFSAPFNLDAVGAGDEVHVVGGYTYIETAGVTIPTGSISNRIAIKSIDSSGDDVYVDRVGTSPLSTTTMAEINITSGYMGVNSYITLKSIFLDTDNTANYASFFNHNADFISVINCVIKNSSPSSNGGSVYLDDQNYLYDSDFICLSTTSTNYNIHLSHNCSVSACYITSISEDQTLLDVAIQLHAGFNVFDGVGGIAIGLGDTYYNSIIFNNTFYNASICISIRDASERSMMLNVYDNVAEASTKFISSSAVKYGNVGTNNVLNGIADAYRYENIEGVVGVNDISNSSATTSNFTSAATGNFIPVSGADVINAGLMNNTVGAYERDESTGGGGDTVVISKGMLGVLG